MIFVIVRYIMMLRSYFVLRITGIEPGAKHGCFSGSPTDGRSFEEFKEERLQDWQEVSGHSANAAEGATI